MKYCIFEDMPVWISIRKFIKKIYTASGQTEFRRDFALRDQIRRASISILLNLAEGFERKTNRDFAKFVNQSKASAGEVRCALYIAQDLSYLSESEFDILFQEIKSIGNQLSKFERYLLSSANK
jgi:four helix bundle protein